MNQRFEPGALPVVAGRLCPLRWTDASAREEKLPAGTLPPFCFAVADAMRDAAAVVILMDFAMGFSFGCRRKSRRDDSLGPDLAGVYGFLEKMRRLATQGPSLAASAIVLAASRTHFPVTP